jgi:FAD:protein FMN transferase
VTRGRGLLLALALAGLASGASAPDPAAPGAPPRPVTWATQTMGTYANLVVITPDSAAMAPVVARAFGAFHRVDSLMSNWTTTSEVARINRVAAAGPTVMEPEVAEVVRKSLEVWRLSDGAFDITVEPLVRAWGFLGGPRRVPSEAEARAAFRLVGAQRLHYDDARHTLRFDLEGMKIDLGGIAKGYAVDCAAETLRAHGVTDALVNVSGNMEAIGHPEGSDHWRIGIRDPRDRMPYFARLELHDREGLSTSAKYEQFVAQDGKTYGHIMDPRTGRPAEGLISVTVVAPNGYISDAWDTPLFVLGPAGARRKAHELAEIAVVLVQPGEGGVDTVWVESSLASRFVLEPQARDLFRVVFF